jgi:hypothetical protein
MHDDATSRNGHAPASANASATSEADAETQRLIEEFGACAALLLERAHCWHPLGQPSRNAAADFLSRLCCWCAPAGVQLCVGIKTPHQNVVDAERERHGPGVVLWRIDPDPEMDATDAPTPIRPPVQPGRTPGGIILPGWA